MDERPSGVAFEKMKDGRCTGMFTIIIGKPLQMNNDSLAFDVLDSVCLITL